MKRAYLRVDGNTEIGLGHLIRCIALAQMIKDDFDIHFVSKDAPPQVIQDILESNFKFIKIYKESAFFNLLKESDIVIIDHYGLDSKYQKKIKTKVYKLVCIDDLHDKSFDADLIINHAPGVEPRDYDARSYSQFALGPNFALLRPEFLKAALERPKQNINRRLLICFGGSDINNLTCQALEALYSNPFFEEIFVITGVSFSFGHQLGKLVKLDNRIKWLENQSAREMLEYMQKCQYVLAPASSIAYELLSAGCTWLGGYYVENQKRIYEGFKQMNCLVDLGNLNKNLTPFLSKYDGSQIQLLSKENPIDGKSDLRIKDLFTPYVSSITC